MKKPGMVIVMVAGTLLMTASAFPQNEKDMGQGRATVTILAKQSNRAPVVLPPQKQSVNIKLDGKQATITGWEPFRGANNKVEVVVLIDGSARTSLGMQMAPLADFINSLPPNVKAVIAYMVDGSAVFMTPMSANHAQILQGLQLPQGSPGSSASPYFSLSDLAKRWPSQDPKARREVLMISDGVDDYEMSFNPNDPYVHAAINDAIHARMIVYALYWHDQGRAFAGYNELNIGQNLMLEVTEATGGVSFWNEPGNPVNYQPFLNKFLLCLQNQYEVSFSTNHLRGKSEMQNFEMKIDQPGLDVSFPRKVLIEKADAAE